MNLQRSRILVATFVLGGSLPVASVSSAAVFQSAYPVSMCKFGQFYTCGSSGVCVPPSDYITVDDGTETDWPVYTYGNGKLILDTRPHPTTGFPITFICPMMRYQSGTSSALDFNASAMVSGYTLPYAGEVDCTVSSLSAYGVLVTSTLMPIFTYSGVDTTHVGQGSIASGSNTGSTNYVMSCVMGGSGSAGSWTTTLFDYRAQETASGTLPGTATYPSSICVPQGTSASSGPTLGGPNGQLRYLVGAAQNGNTYTNMPVECPLPDTNSSGARTVCVSMTEVAAGSTHSSCSLVVRDPWYGKDYSLEESSSMGSISSNGAQQLCKTAATDYGYAMSYAVVCNLTPSSSINSVSISGQ